MRGVRLLVLMLAVWQPAAALQLPPDAERATIHPGAWSFKMRRAAGPWAIDGFYWERSEARLDLAVTAGGDVVHALEPTSRQIARLTNPQRRPVAAVNGDFYVMAGSGRGATVGLFVRAGELLCAGSGRPVFLVLSDGTPQIAPARSTLRLEPAGDGPALAITRLNLERTENSLVLYSSSWGPTTDTNASGVEVALRGPGRLTPQGTWALTVAGEPVAGRGNLAVPTDGYVLSGHGSQAAAVRALRPGQTFTLHVETTPNLPIREAIGGNQVLLAGGRIVPTAQAGEPRHPRTMVGFDDRHVVCVTVDGRRPGHSVGMTYLEQARLLAELGCQEALNLDGGGSTTCWVRGTILNRPSDGRERSVANALALLSKAPLGEPATVVFDPPGPVLLAPGARFQPRVRVADALYNPLAADTPVTVTAEGGVGQFEGTVFTAATQPAQGRLVARAGQATGELAVEVVDRVAALRAEPSRLELLSGEAVALTATGTAADGRPVLLSPGALTATVTGDSGRLEGATFTAGPEGARGSVRLAAYGARAEVPVAVAAPVVVEDFEAGPAGRFSSVPEGVTGTVETITGDAAVGRGFARLAYHLTDQPVTRAAYLRLDRRLGAALALRCRARGDGQAVWLRAAVLDGNGVRETYNLHDGVLGRVWTTLQAALPKGLKQPVTWESVYVVALGSSPLREGTIEWDCLETLQIPGN